jgi:hypothetical protein
LQGLVSEFPDRIVPVTVPFGAAAGTWGHFLLIAADHSSWEILEDPI